MFTPSYPIMGCGNATIKLTITMQTHHEISLNKIKDFPLNSRVWVYQSNRFFTTDEATEIDVLLNEFNQSWSAHNAKLQSEYLLLHHLFIVLVVNETQHSASGCSIDSSVGIIKQIMERYKVDLLDRLNLAYQKNEAIQLIKMADFQEEIKNGVFTPETIVFNNLIQDKAGLINQWYVPAKSSWHINLF